MSIVAEHSGPGLSGAALAQEVRRAITTQTATDLHTHVFSPRFGCSPDQRGLMLWGIDDLVTYHYLVAEVFRVEGPPKFPLERFWAMDRGAQADHIWRHLFVERAPLSEACRGVVTTLTRLGLDPHERSLDAYRRWFAQQSPDRHVDRVMELAGVDSITMTNEVFDPHEQRLWLSQPSLGGDPRFRSVLRIDRLLLDFHATIAQLRSEGYDVTAELSERTLGEVRRFIEDWLTRMGAVYIAASLPPDWRFPSGATIDTLLQGAVLPAARDRGVPLALMIGVRRGVNPLLRMAGDMVGPMDIASLTHLLAAFPDNRFLVTVLARENQHELAVAARKFPNLMVFGCWWFVNVPSLIREITRFRLELLGTTFIPQHSDARILDQLIYKWDHSRRLIADALLEQYEAAASSGLRVTPAQVRADAARLLRDNFHAFLRG